MTDPTYQLAHEPDGTSYTVRENLVDILERELLGPTGGPEELLPVSPRQVYLVGHIAPMKLADRRADPGEGGDDLTSVRTDEEGPQEQRGPPAEPADGDGTGGDSSDDTAEDAVPRQGLMIPASMGLRFQIPRDLADFTVTATWGTYHSVKTGEVDRNGRAVPAYRRTPVGVTERIALADLTPSRTYTRVLTGQVCLRIDAYDEAAYDRWLVEIALCNDRETPPTIPVSEWMFQTKLHVDAGGAAGVPAGARRAGARRR